MNYIQSKHSEKKLLEKKKEEQFYADQTNKERLKQSKRKKQKEKLTKDYQNPVTKTQKEPSPIFDDIANHLDDDGFFDNSAFINSSYETEVIIGGRNIGKTYSTIKYMIHELYLKQGFRFMFFVQANNHLGAQRTRLDKVVRQEKYNVIVDAKLAAPSILIYYDKARDNAIMGYAVSVSSAYLLKEADFELVKMIMVDEFNMKFFQMHDYFSLIETVKRDSDIKIMLLGNNMKDESNFQEIFDISKSNVDEERSIRVSIFKTSPVYAKATMQSAKGTFYERQARYNKLDFVDLYAYLFEYYLEPMYNIFFKEDYQAYLEKRDEANIAYELFQQGKIDKKHTHERFMIAESTKLALNERVKALDVIDRLITLPGNTFIQLIYDDATVLTFLIIEPLRIFDLIGIPLTDKTQPIFDKIPEAIVYQEHLQASEDIERIRNQGKDVKNTYYVLLESQKYYSVQELTHGRMEATMLKGESPVHQFIRTATNNPRVSFKDSATYMVTKENLVRSM